MGKANSRLRLLTVFVLITAITTSAIGFVYLQYFLPQKTNSDSLPYITKTQSIFEPVLPNVPVKLPEDFSLHGQYQHELWHYFAMLEDDRGEKYSLQWTYIRIATDDRESKGWQEPHLYISYAVIANETETWREQRLARGGIGQAGFSHKPFHLWIDNWNLTSSSQAPFPGHLSLISDTFDLQLNITSSAPCVLPGDKGYVENYPLLSVASYNLACPFLKVEGDIKLGKKGLTYVEGQGWISKEWGTGLIRPVSKHMDWFTFNLDHETVLSVTRYSQSTTSAHWRGELYRIDGQVLSLLPQGVSIQPTEFSFLTGGKRIPTKWRVVVKELGIDLVISAIDNDFWLPFVIPYWQGPIRASGSHEASGFMLLMGY